MVNSYTDYRIVQLVAALPGWKVTYRQNDGSLEYEDVACFALAFEMTREMNTMRIIREEETPSVYAIVGVGDSLSIAEDMSNFARLVSPSESRKATTG